MEFFKNLAKKKKKTKKPTKLDGKVNMIEE